MNEIEDLKEQGYRGFVTVEKLTSNTSVVTKEPGVYFILRTSSEAPSFLTVGTGGHFKGKNPNVTISELERNWIDNTQIIYIGKATSLQKRLKQYMEFGKGKDVAHWGGRYIWQLKDAKELVVCWHTCLTPALAGTTETDLIEKFKTEHNGMRPFANLRD